MRALMRRKPEALRYVSFNLRPIFTLVLFFEFEIKIEVEVEVEVEIETLLPPKHLKRFLQSRALFIYQS